MFSARFSDFLQNNNISEYKIAKGTGISQGLINDYKKGNKSPTINNMSKIAEYLDCSVDYLLGRTQDSKSHKETPSSDTEGEVQEIINIFLNLNQEGRKRLMQQAEDISEIDKYKKCDDAEQDVG